MSTRSWVSLIALSALWGLAFVLAGYAIQTLPPLTVAAVRVGIAALGLMAVCMIVRPTLPPTVGGWLALAVMGLLNNAIPFF